MLIAATNEGRFIQLTNCKILAPISQGQEWFRTHTTNTPSVNKTKCRILDTLQQAKEAEIGLKKTSNIKATHNPQFSPTPNLTGSFN